MDTSHTQLVDVHGGHHGPVLDEEDPIIIKVALDVSLQNVQTSEPLNDVSCICYNIPDDQTEWKELARLTGGASSGNGVAFSQPMLLDYSFEKE
jgi:hypothetical protein